jgi:hypothetical protein
MTAPFDVDFGTLPVAHRYKLLAALVVPRPIAFHHRRSGWYCQCGTVLVFQCIQ